MANNPVQVVLNASDYIQRAESSGGGFHKDFYAGNDAAFREHKQELISAIGNVRAALARRPERSRLEFARVVLQGEAWAKTRRPGDKLFPQERVPVVGGGELGEIFVELTPDNIQQVEQSIASAEETTTWVERNNKRLPKPTRQRSEVGAVKGIRLNEPSDRRSFSAEQAAKWLRDPRTGGAYIVETFVSELRGEAPGERRSSRIEQAFGEFWKELFALNVPVEVMRVGDRWTSVNAFLLRLKTPDPGAAAPTRDHETVLDFLCSQPLIKRVLLPPIIERTHAVREGGRHSEGSSMSRPDPTVDYPVVGIIDTGVVENDPLQHWCVGRTEFLDHAIQDLSHGTFIAGLCVAAHELNVHGCLQEYACTYFDVGLFPTDNGAFATYFPRGFLDFLEQLDHEIAAAVEQGVRVFNMSLSVVRAVQDDGYGIFAAMLDEIADKHDVLFILPAGNLEGHLPRLPWPIDSAGVLKMLAEYRFIGQDRILQPADSVRSIAVGALEPPAADGLLRPAQYTRRGPGVALGSKPDVAHVGGRLAGSSGLASFDVKGNIVQGCGTSYAAPLVAKTAATIDRLIEGDVPREMLIALIAHHSDVPPGLDCKELKQLVRDFVGFGLPATATDILEAPDHKITLVFSGTLNGGYELQFPFAWPGSLVGPQGQCRGEARLTLAYSPPIDAAFGSEYVRVNADAYLRQEHIDKSSGEVSFKGRLADDAEHLYEKELIEHGRKWWPIKKHKGRFPRGIGASSQWRLVVDCLTRANTLIPEAGIAFTAVLTIADLKKAEPVFNDVRQSLRAHGVTIVDVRTAQRIQTRTNG